MLAALAKLAKSDELKEEAGPVSAPSSPGAVDESALEAVMDEFRRAPDSKAALRSLRALIAQLK